MCGGATKPRDLPIEGRDLKGNQTGISFKEVDTIGVMETENLEVVELTEKDKNRYKFFDQFLSLCNQKTSLFSSVSPVGYQNWVNAGAG